MRDIYCVLFCLSIFCSFGLLRAATEDKQCPKPIISKKTIIRTTESIENGAELLTKKDVKNARYCYDLCCSTDKCNVALMHYKSESLDEYSGDVKTIKICYLFACGSPSVCSFDYHSRYAIIKINRPPKDEIQSAANDDCPPGTPVAMCSDDPCTTHTCPAYKDALCKANYCGGCHAYFYDRNNNLLNCTHSETPPTESSEHDIKNALDHNEQSVVVEFVDYAEAPSVGLVAPNIPKHNEIGNENNEDPYFQTDRRTWLTDGPDDDMNKSVSPLTTVTAVVIEKTMTDGNHQETIIIEHRDSGVFIPLLIGLVICILFIFGLIYHFKCSRRGKPKKVAVDDADYLINGMYL